MDHCMLYYVWGEMESYFCRTIVCCIMCGGKWNLTSAGPLYVLLCVGGNGILLLTDHCMLYYVWGEMESYFCRTIPCCIMCGGKWNLPSAGPLYVVLCVGGNGILLVQDHCMLYYVWGEMEFYFCRTIVCWI